MSVGLIIAFLLSIPVHTKKKKTVSKQLKFPEFSKIGEKSSEVPFGSHLKIIVSQNIADKLKLVELHRQHKIVNKRKSVSFGTIRSRKNRGWSDEKIVNTPKVAPKDKNKFRKYK